MAAWLRRLLLPLVCVSLVACSSVAGKLPRAADNVTPISKPGYQYLLQPGDVLETHYGSNPGLNEQSVIAPDGRISFFGAPNLMAAGSTVDDLRKTIRSTAGVIDHNFNVLLRSSVGVRVYVTGEVPTPGEIVSAGQISALQAVARAGGFKLGAQSDEVVLIRHDDQSAPAKVYAVDLAAASDGGGPGNDVWLQPYDIIYVPRDRIGNVSLIFERIRQAVPFVFSFVYGNSNGNF